MSKISEIAPDIIQSRGLLLRSNLQFNEFLVRRAALVPHSGSMT